MEYFVVFLVLCVAGSLEALKCEFGNNNGENVRQALSQCLNSNETEHFWKMAMMDESDEGSSEEGEHSMTNSMNGSNSSTVAKTKRAVDDKMTKPGTDTDSNTTEEPDNGDSNEACLIQCVFTNMDLMDTNGMPDHSKLLEGLLKTATSRELRNFFQDTVDECYQELNEGNKMDSCSFSTKLVKCLVEKGKANCADWPAGGLPF
ncbi:odorant-binding protein 59a [Diabrotica virgifera virgifera]|uniref:Uncharacterized protein n=1 Tax=Diabrotica virgifera virgifera TaxID=50390 RepID=A0ABM5K9X7_DIAVI|nr:odorant-binding protein 59a [Diabrotica virgifera virgifera]